MALGRRSLALMYGRYAPRFLCMSHLSPTWASCVLSPAPCAPSRAAGSTISAPHMRDLADRSATIALFTRCSTPCLVPTAHASRTHAPRCRSKAPRMPSRVVRTRRRAPTSCNEAPFSPRETGRRSIRGPRSATAESPDAMAFGGIATEAPGTTLSRITNSSCPPGGAVPPPIDAGNERSFAQDIRIAVT